MTASDGVIRRPGGGAEPARPPPLNPPLYISCLLEGRSMFFLRFLCRCTVIGCPHLALSDRAWIKAVGSHGDDVMVRCNDTLETWYLSCQGNQWIGYYDNCTSTRKTTFVNTVVYFSEMWKTYMVLCSWTIVAVLLVSEWMNLLTFYHTDSFQEKERT